jgi:hypothetical protein
MQGLQYYLKIRVICGRVKQRQWCRDLLTGVGMRGCANDFARRLDKISSPFCVSVTLSYNVLQSDSDAVHTYGCLMSIQTDAQEKRVYKYILFQFIS